jgi:lipid-binding SYLF domain-containing protein
MHGSVARPEEWAYVSEAFPSYFESEPAMSALPKVVLAVSVVVAVAFSPAARAAVSVKDAQDAIAAIKKADPSISKFFDKAAGYVIFPNVAKGGLIVGGAGGEGYLFQKGTAVGKTTLSQASIGAQVGGQTYYEVIFFEDPKKVEEFKKGQWTMAAQVSAVALSSGASANAKYTGGVAVFTLTKGGAMAEASVGGQKFSYEPIVGQM